MLFSLITTTWSFLGWRLNISFVTACPIDPAPPINKKVEDEIIHSRSFSFLVISFENKFLFLPIKL